MKRTLDQVKGDQAKIRAAYKRLFGSAEAELVMKDLDFRFNRTTLKKHDGVIDPYASIASAGCREVLLYIDYMMEKETNAVTE